MTLVFYPGPWSEALDRRRSGLTLSPRHGLLLCRIYKLDTFFPTHLALASFPHPPPFGISYTPRPCNSRDRASTAQHSTPLLAEYYLVSQSASLLLLTTNFRGSRLVSSRWSTQHIQPRATSSPRPWCQVKRPNWSTISATWPGSLFRRHLSSS